MTPEEMLVEGWCDDCDCDFMTCQAQGYCQGEVKNEQSVADNDVS